jgi:hypothetical protein
MELTYRREKFAQLVAQGYNQTEAYRRAGYACDKMLAKTVWERASDVARSSKVKARILVLREAVSLAVVADMAWTAERFVGEAQANLAQARNLDQMAPANGALKLIGDATGLTEAARPDGRVQVTKVVIVLGDGHETVIEHE